MKKSRDAYGDNRKEFRHNKHKRVEFTTNHDKRNTGFSKDYQLFATSVHREPKYEWKRDVGCQCYVRNNMTGHYSPKREEVVYYSGFPRQIYAYSRTRSFTDVGVGSVMLQQKKRVRKIYLPETVNRGVGSEDLTSYILENKPKPPQSRPRYGREENYFRYGREDNYLRSDREDNYYRSGREDNYFRHGREDYTYFPKKISKCVGGTMGNVKQCSEKLSPITCYNKSKGTSPIEVEEEKKLSKDTANNTVYNNIANNTTQVERSYERNKSYSNRMDKDSSNSKEKEPIDKVKSEKSPDRKLQVTTVQKSSDSLEQHVHNLENPSYIPSTGSSDPMENKLEKEYRRMFSNKNKDDKPSTDKPINDLKSTSMLRRRFEALKRGIAKKDDTKKNIHTTSKDSNPAAESSGLVQISGTVPSAAMVENSATPIHVDISVESDPPSLEARSYSHTKLFSPDTSTERRSRNETRKKPHTGKKERESVHWSPPDKTKADDSDVQGMFKVWGEKFDFEQGKTDGFAGVSFDHKAKGPGIDIREEEAKTESQEKKEGKRFFFFKKKSKDKNKSPCKSKKGVTTGRCEVKNRLVIHGSTPKDASPIKTHQTSEEKPKINPKKSEETDEIIKKNWLQKFIQRTIESRKSLQIRWNNKTYTTSSSTVFELMDNVYRQTELVIRSRSETTTATSSYYQSYNRHHVNFVQDIEAWMVPKLIKQREVPFRFYRKEQQTGKSDRKWFIDKSKAFAHKIELVLHSKNFVKCHRAMSSEFLRIDIPKGFFTDLSSDSDRFATSNSEEVYKIVEYESPESRSELKANNDIGDHLHDDGKVAKKVSVRDKNVDTRVIETVIKMPPVHRDVVIQGSNVHIPKRCDVIGVGIITHRDIRELGKPIMKIDDELSEEESELAVENSIKQCEFAESYLRDYYRNWMPLGIELFPSRASDFYVKCDSVETLCSYNNQGDGTKSCPNLKDYQSPLNLNPASSNSYSYKDTDKTKIFNTFKSLTHSEPPLETRRILPKDSFEVLKKRMLYACGNRAKWIQAEDQPYSIPSLQDKAEQDAGVTCEIKEYPTKRKKCAKHVSITHCDNPSGDDPIPIIHLPPIKKEAKQIPGILSFCKKSGADTKHATVREDENCEIYPAYCKEYCEQSKNPNCSKPKPRSSSESSACSQCTLCDSKRSPSPQKSCLPNNIPPPEKQCPPPKKQCPPTKKECPPPKKECPPPKKESPPPKKECPPIKRECPPTKNECPSPQKQCPSPPKQCPPPQNQRPSTQKQCPSSPQRPCPLSRNVCSCTCTPTVSSPLISTTVSPILLPQVMSSMAQIMSPLSISLSNPCPCSPEFAKLQKMPKLPPPKPCTCASKASVKDKRSKDNSSPKVCPPSPPKNQSPPRSQQSAGPSRSCPKATGSLSPLSHCTPVKLLNSDQSTEIDSCACKPPSNCSPKNCRTPIASSRNPCTECFRRDQLRNSGTNPGINPPEQLASPSSSKSTQIDPNSPEICPGSPCSTRISELTKKAQSMPKIQGVHLRIKPNPPPIKCIGDCPQAQKTKEKGGTKSPATENNSSLSNEKDDISCFSDEKLAIRIKKTTESTEEIRETQNFKVKDAAGNTVCERRDYKADVHRETHMPPVLGEMYKVNRLATAKPENIEEMQKQDDNYESTKSEASIANMIEISFGLKVTQGDKIAEFNLTDDKKEELDKTQIKCKPDKSQDVFMITDDVEPANDESNGVNDKNDINIKIVIKNFKSKTEKSSKRIKNDDFSKKISQKFHTVSTGYSDVLQDQVDNMYSIHRTTIDLTTSKTIMQEKCGEIENSETNVEKLQSKDNNEEKAIEKEIETATIDTNEVAEKLQVQEEIKNIPENIITLDANEATKISETCNSIHKVTCPCDYLKNNKTETTVNADQSNLQIKSSPKIQKSDTYPILHKSETQTIKNDSELNKIFPKSFDKLQTSDICEVILAETIEEMSQLSQRIEITENGINIPERKIIDNKQTSENNSKIENNTLNESKMKIRDEKIEIVQAMETTIRNTIENIADSGKRIQNTVNDKIINKVVSIKDKYKNCCEIRVLSKSELFQKSSETEERIRNIENYEQIPEKKSNIADIKNSKTNKPEIIIQTANTKNDALISETIQITENWERITGVEEVNNGQDEKTDQSEVNHHQEQKKEKDTAANEIHEEIRKFENFLKMQRQFQFSNPKSDEKTSKVDIAEENEIIVTTIDTQGGIKEPLYNVKDITKDDKKMEPDTERLVMQPDPNIVYSTTHLSVTDTDEVDVTNTSDEVNDIVMDKPHTKREKKEMLKHVFEKATCQKWKSKGRMKRLRNMLKSILTSDSSEVEEATATNKALLKDLTYSSFSPKYFKDTDSLTNYYRVENVVQSDGEEKMGGSVPTRNQSEDDRYSDSSECQPNMSKCLCNTMAEKMRKQGEVLMGGCCCRGPPKVHEQTSCDLNTGLYINYKAAEYIDVQTQNSIINSRITNVMVMKKMESVMTSKTSSDAEKINSTVSPYRSDKECEAKNTNTMLGLLDDGKIVIRTSDENKLSVQTEIFIGWKGKEKKKQKERHTAYFESPADILQSYETKKAVLEIYTEKTVSDEGEKLVAKLPKFVYDKEEEIEKNFVRNVLLAHEKG